jgi:DNA-binding HxlR family transcriptional regulator
MVDPEHYYKVKCAVPKARFQMGKRSYNEYCGLAKALDIVGERWTLLIVRNLLLGPLRYSELLRGLPGITTNLLAKRLKEMERSGLLERTRRGPLESGSSYRLTELGLALEPAVQALASWGWHRMTGPGPGEHRDLEWLLVSTRGRYRGDLHLSAEFIVADATYHFLLAGDEITIGRGPLSEADLRVRIREQMLVQLLLRGWPEAGEPFDLEVEGEIEQLRSLLDAFARPPGSMAEVSGTDGR